MECTTVLFLFVLLGSYKLLFSEHAIRRGGYQPPAMLDA